MLHLHLGHHLKAHAVVPRTELPNVGGAAWFLHAKLIARETKDDQALVLVHVVQFLQRLVRTVYQNDAVFTMSTRLPRGWLQIKVVAFQSGGAEVVERCHAWYGVVPSVGVEGLPSQSMRRQRTNARHFAKMVVMFMGEKRGDCGFVQCIQRRRSLRLGSFAATQTEGRPCGPMMRQAQVREPHKDGRQPGHEGGFGPPHPGKHRHGGSHHDGQDPASQAPEPKGTAVSIAVR